MTKIVLIHPDADDAEDLQKEKPRRGKKGPAGGWAGPGGHRPESLNLHAIMRQRKAEDARNRRRAEKWGKGGRP